MSEKINHYLIKTSKKLGVNIFIALIIALLFFMPDVVMKLLGIFSHKVFLLIDFYLLFAFSLLLLGISKWNIQCLVLLFLFIMQTVGSIYIAYFGSEIMPEMIHKFFDNPMEDVFEISMILFSSFSCLHVLLLSIVLTYLIIGVLLFKTKNITFKIPGSGLSISVILLSSLLIAFIRPHSHESFYNPIKPSLFNSINSFSTYISQILRKNQHNKNQFLEYQIITSKAPESQNIILIMGESTRSDYMSLFGYSAPTTPRLDQRKLDPNFIYAPAFSSSIATSSSLQIFFNLMLEPGNLDNMIKKNVNLFKLAKKQGFKTTLISAQSATVLFNVGTGYIDNLITSDTIDKESFKNKRDQVLLDLLRKANLSDKNFIVLHMRSMHAPYENNYLHKKFLAIYSEEEISKENDPQKIHRLKYANAMRFNDLVIDEIMQYSQENFKGPSYVFYTSDHGEMLGEEKLFGHNHMHIQCAEVPFLVLGIRPEKDFMDKLRNIKALTHYDIGLLIADRIGFVLHNPNVNSKELRYVHGPSIMYPYSFLQFELDKKGQPINIQKGHTLNGIDHQITK